jgi:hypothetical protein
MFLLLCVSFRNNCFVTLLDEMNFVINLFNVHIPTTQKYTAVNINIFSSIMPTAYVGYLRENGCS